MQYKPSLKSMKTFLNAQGHDADSKGQEEIFELYKRVCREKVGFFQSSVFDKSFFEAKDIKDTAEFVNLSGVIASEVAKVGDSLARLYALMDKYIEQCPYEELRFLIFSGAKRIAPSILKKAFSVKYHQYQEVWLEKIASNLENLPPEERSVLLHHYEQIREDIPQLFRVYQQSFQPHEIEKMKKIAQDKLLLMQHFNPQLLEENYKAFYDGSEEKISLIREIMALTHSYPKGYLQHIPMSALRNLKEDILQQKRAEESSKKKVAEHIRRLEESMMMINDSEFDAACMDAIKELDNDELQKIVQYINSQDKFFANKFESIAKQLRGSIKAKII